MEGNLYKWTNYISCWKHRYFVLKGSILNYYLKKGDKPKGKIHLAVAAINSGEDETKFQIDTGISILHLKAESKEEKNKWVRELRKAKIEADRMAHHKCDAIQAKQIQTQPIPQTGRSNNMSFPEHLAVNTIDTFDSEWQSHSILIKLQKIKNIQNDIKTNNIQVRYLMEDSHASREEIFNKVMELADLNEEKLEKLALLTEYLINDLNHCENEYKNLGKLFNPSVENINKFPIAESTTAENTLATNDETGDINAIPTSKSKSKFIEALNRRDTGEIIQKNNEIFYEADELENINEFNAEEEKNIKEVKEVKPRRKEDQTEEKLEINLQGDLSEKLPEHTDYMQNNQIMQVNNMRFFDHHYNEKRLKLPTERHRVNFSIWGVIKDALGKDLNKFAVPVYFNEPLSMLQRLCENFQYTEVLNKAALDPNPYMRLAYVAAFCISGYALNPKRTLKFFNPLLGETYEYIDNELNFRYFSEQVSHHPAISACYVEGENFTFYSNTNVKSNFKVMKATLEFLPISKSYITFTKFNEKISFSKPIAAARNLLGSVYIDCYGKFTVTNHDTGDYAEIEIFEASKSEQGKLKGVVKDMNGDVRLELKGNWLSQIEVFDIEKDMSTVIWKKFQIPGDEEARYFFTDFAINLNNINDHLRKALPPTDSRLRPDQRALEMNDLDLASKEKLRLEDKQRAKRKKNEKKKLNHRPLYFQEAYDDLSGELIYEYTRDYWKDRQTKNFSHFPDIF